MLESGRQFGNHNEDIPFVIFGLALAFESIHLIHVVCFVVAPVEEHAVGA